MRCLFLAFGTLNNWSNAGLFYCNGNNGLSNANWDILARLSLRKRKIRSRT